jgi:hypothetical protein
MGKDGADAPDRLELQLGKGVESETWVDHVESGARADRDLAGRKKLVLAGKTRCICPWVVGTRGGRGGKLYRKIASTYQHSNFYFYLDTL